MPICLFQCSAEKEKPIDYLGQKPPGKVAELFAPDIMSTNANEHSAPAFSPDGSIVLWSIMDSNYKGHIFEMKYENGAWSKPAMPSFADTTADYYCPSFSIDGNTLFFSSRRKAPEGYPEGRGNRIWSINKTKDGWGTPVPFDTIVSKAQEFSHSVTKNGTFYFSSALAGGSNVNIYKAEKNNTGYTEPVLLPDSINSIGYEDGPYIAPDESFLIFESTRPEGIEGSHDLYISFKNKNGRWGMPINMGSQINSASMERFPRLSPDGKYLFFASNRDQSAGKVGFDIYWIDANVIEELRSTASTNSIIE